MDENFAREKFREIPFALDIKFYFAGGKFRAKSKFANIAKISSMREIRVIGAYSTYDVGAPVAVDYVDKSADFRRQS